MLQCWQTNRTFVIKTLNFFPTKAVDFCEKILLLNQKVFSQKPSSWQIESWFDSPVKNVSPKNQEEIDAEQNNEGLWNFLSKQLSLKRFSWHAECILNKPNWKNSLWLSWWKVMDQKRKKINKINFLDKSFFTQDIPLDSWEAVRKTWTPIFHQVSKWILPMP